MRALSDPASDVATSFFWQQPEDGGDKRRLIAPLGGAVDIGWHRNLFGGPCFFAKVSALPFIDEATRTGVFDAWTVYAALACGGLTIALIPEPLYTTPDDARAVTLARLEAVVHQYHVRRPEAIDLRWISRRCSSHQWFRDCDDADAAGSTPGTRGSGARKACTSRFINLPDAELRGFAELEPSWATSIRSSGISPCSAPHRAARGRWNTTSPRVFVSGSGLHTRVLLTAFPVLGRFIAGFIDRRPEARVLGKPCVRPRSSGTRWPT